MDSYEASRAVFSRIQTIDPDNASKIIAYILLQDQPEKEMIRLAFGPENLIHSIVNVAKSELGLSSNTLPALNSSSPPPLFSPVSNPISISRPNNNSLPSPRLGFHASSPSSPSIWSVSSPGSVPSPLSSSSQSALSRPNFVDDYHQSFEDEAQFHQIDGLAQQQRLAAAQFMAGMNFPYNKLNLLQTGSQRSAAAALMMGEEYHKLNRCRFGRNDFSVSNFGDSNPGSRQIYLTFPADSTFKEEDVSNYFSIFGPVQDVRIPYQQKRMFGFVTFLYPETVRIILAKGNPHFVCDSRVLVKPYKEKAKLPDKKQQQHQLDRPEFSSCGSPSGIDCREPFEMHIGPRMFHSNQEMMLRKRLEQEADWQEALELQSRRLMDLQLLDLKNHNLYNQSVPVRSPGMLHIASEDNNLGSPNGSPNAVSGCINEGSDLPESMMEHILPDSLFASPTKFSADERSPFVNASTSTAHNDCLTPPTSALKSCFLEIPRISSAIGM